MRQHVETPGMGKRLCAVIASGLLAASTVGAPLAAFAVTPSTGSQTGTGVTDVTVQLIDSSTEHGGTTDSTNPDSDHDGLGDNLAFTVPASINFVAKADGTLIGPEAASTYIENESAFAIHASSFDVDAESPWTIVADATAVSTANAADFSFGPTDDVLNAASYLTKASVGNASKWNMAAKTDADATDRVQLNTSGHVNNVTQGIQSKTKIATIRTYVTPGAATSN